MAETSITASAKTSKTGLSKKDLSKKPTEAELEILHVLWQHGPSTVRQVHEVLRADRDLGYTTVLKLLQIMTSKGMVQRNEEQRAHVYATDQPAEQTKRLLANDVLQRVFEGSASDLMMHALAGREVSGAEIDELRRLIDSIDDPAEPASAGSRGIKST